MTDKQSVVEKMAQAFWFPPPGQPKHDMGVAARILAEDMRKEALPKGYANDDDAAAAVQKNPGCGRRHILRFLGRYTKEKGID